MKSYLNIIVLCLALFGCVLADSVVGPGCSVSIATTARAGGSFQSGSGVSQIYDIVITNTGRCSADAIAINIDLVAPGSITEKWNLESGTRYYTVTSFGATLPVGNSVNTGIVVNFPNTQTVPANAVSTTVYGTLCPSECVNQGQSATTASVANTATTSSIPSSTTGSAPSSTTGSASSDDSDNDSSCVASVVLTARSGGSFSTGSGMSQIYDAAITNSGSCGITNIILQLGLPANAQVTSSWNLVANGNLRYTVTSYEGLLPVGSTVNAGFIVNFPNTQTIPAGVSAAPSTTTCPASCSAPGTGSGSAATTGSEPSPVTTGLPSSTTGSQQPAGCTVSTTTTARAGSSYQSGSGVSQIYDIVVTNSGSCAVNNIILTASLPAGAAIQSTWNLNLNSGLSYTVTSYEGTLPVGNSVNAGFIVNFPNTQTVPAGVNTAATTTTCNECAARR